MNDKNLSEIEDRDKLLWKKKLDHNNKIARAVESVRNGMTYRQAEIEYGIDASTISNNCRKQNVISKRKPVNSRAVRHTIVSAMIESGSSIEEMHENVAATEGIDLSYTTFYGWLCRNNYISKIKNRRYRDTSR